MTDPIREALERLTETGENITYDEAAESPSSVSAWQKFDVAVSAARAALAAPTEPRIDVWLELANAADSLTQFVRLGDGPLGSDPAAIAMRRLFDALDAVKDARLGAGREEAEGVESLDVDLDASEGRVHSPEGPS